MSFNSRTEFIKAQSSDKLTLAHVEARSRLFEWIDEGGGIWSKIIPYFIIELKNNYEIMANHGQLSGLNEGMFYYDARESKLYAHFMGSVDPTTIDAIATYRLFFSTGPAVLSWDLTNTGAQVQYQGRIISTPGYKHKVGVDQGLTSIVGSGTLKLENGDGGLDRAFDALYFENREVTIFSWNKDLQYSDAKIIYRGRVTNKRFGPNDISFLIKDVLFDLEQAIPLDIYDDSDFVNDSIKGRYKRQLYGRVDGLQLQSVDQISDGYALTGVVSADAISETLNGIATLFLSEASPSDRITIGSQEFNIKSITSDTELILDNKTTFSFVNQNAVLLPDIPTTIKNRKFLVAGHACSNIAYSVVNVIQLNRVELSGTDGLTAGDFIEFQSNGERKEIKNIAPGNIVVLRSNIVNEPVISSLVIRQPIQKIYKGSSLINSDNFVISNLGSPVNECSVTLSPLVEFNLARPTALSVSLTFTNASRDVTTVGGIDLRELFSPRDWLRPADLSYTTYYEILSVSESSLQLRVPFSEVTITDSVTAKLPDYIGDDTILSAEVIGKTVNSEPDGEWIQTGAQVVRDILTQIKVNPNIINETSFALAKNEARQLISITVPVDIGGGTVTAKDIIDKINKTVSGSLTLDNELKLKYKILQNNIPDNPIIVNDEDLIKWNIQTTNGKNFRDSLVRYRHKDIDRSSLEPGSLVKTFTSEFINKYIETSKLEEFDAYLFNENEAAIFAERQVYFNRISQSAIFLNTDLRYENVEIGDIMQLQMKRLYNRLGGDASKKKIAIVIGKTVTGESVELELTDLGNTFNTSAVITPNTTNEFSIADEDEKLKYGFITDNQGIVNDDETTASINLIS